MMPSLLSSRRLNPVVDRYVTTDLPLQEIIASMAPLSSPLVTALALLSDCLDGRRLARDAIGAAKTVPLKGQDPELTVLFLARWAELAARLSNPSEAETLLHQARTLFTDRTHLEIIATVNFAGSVLEAVRGNQHKREERLRKIATDLPEHSPRRKFYLWELGLLLARQGRGLEFQDTMRELAWKTGQRFPLEQLDRLHFVDAVETGRIRAAAERAASIAVAAAPAIGRVPYRDYQQLLGLMHGVLNGETHKGGEPSMTGPVWIQTLHHLLARDSAGALRLSRMEAKRTLSSLFGTGFGSFNLVRSELASGHAEAARRLIEMRRVRGNGHYLDSFFEARTDWLGGRRREAAEKFRQTLDAIDHYEARGRLDVEMALAIELSGADARELTRLAERLRTDRKRPTLPSPPPATDAPPEKPKRAPMLLGRSPAILDLREQIHRMASQDAPVLITGETGTGKELVAAALHDQSARSGEPFVAINCGAISETLLESELFGHERGAFTGADRATGGLFEDAGRGTLLLDEIGDVSARLQTVLLRVLETGQVRAIGSSRARQIHCRILAATHSDLEQRVADGTFRRDLLYRLQRLTIHIPPLRERREDILPLVRHFLDEGRTPGTHASISKAFMEAVRLHDWPGNVRELRNVIERMRLTHSDKRAYDAADLDIRKTPATPSSPRPLPDPPPSSTQPPHRGGREAVSNLLITGTSVLRRTERMKQLFSEHRHLTRAEIVQLMGISPNTATKYLQSLCSEGFIRPVTPTASSRSRYFEMATASGDDRAIYR